jgi:hypothetical protein
MDDYLSKPIELRQLKLLVARWLGDSRTPSVAGAARPDERELVVATVKAA